MRRAVPMCGGNAARSFCMRFRSALSDENSDRAVTDIIVTARSLVKSFLKKNVQIFCCVWQTDGMGGSNGTYNLFFTAAFPAEGFFSAFFRRSRSSGCRHFAGSMPSKDPPVLPLTIPMTNISQSDIQPPISRSVRTFPTYIYYMISECFVILYGGAEVEIHKVKIDRLPFDPEKIREGAQLAKAELFIRQAHLT